MWLDCSDEEQEGQEEAAGERGERCEVWKDRVSGRVEMWSEESEEQGGQRGRGERGERGELRRREREREASAQEERERELREARLEEEQTEQEKNTTDGRPPGLEDVESELKTQEEKKLS